MKILLDTLKNCETKEFINDIFPKFVLNNEDLTLSVGLFVIVKEWA